MHLNLKANANNNINGSPKLKSVPIPVKIFKTVVRSLPRGRMPLLNTFHPYLPTGLFQDRWRAIEMIFNLKDRDSWLLYFHEVSERYQTPYFLEFLADDLTFLDIGANNGYYSLLAASSVSRAKVFAFEPNPQLVEQLNTVLQINNLNQTVKVFDTAINDVEGVVTLDFSNINHRGRGHIVNEVRGDSALTPVRAITIDSWMSENSVKHIELVKIDVEGAEMNVLRGMQRCLRQQAADILFIEVHDSELPSFGTSSSELFNLLKNHGYELRFLPSELSILPGNRYEPCLADIPLLTLAQFEHYNDGWWHCIAFSEKACHQHHSLICN